MSYFWADMQVELGRTAAPFYVENGRLQAGGGSAVDAGARPAGAVAAGTSGGEGESEAGLIGAIERGAVYS